MDFLTDTKTSRQTTKSVPRSLMIAIRIRPLKDHEMRRCIHSVDDQVVVLEESEIDKNDVLRQNRGGDRQYTFNAVFGEDSLQETIYEKTTKSLVNDVLEGYNATIFAYGASGSGKTHTMLGSTIEPGIMVRALSEIFSFIENNVLQQQYHVSMSYLEIYNENIRDLLNPSSGFLELREDQKEKTIHVVKLSEISMNSSEEMMQLLQKGNKARTMEPTALNKTSSRSHALLSITVKQIIPLQTTEKLNVRIKQGKLFMIDLAGSERASQTKNQGKRLVEGAHINRSLLALGNCINALSGGARYVNYRDSKLTRLLKDALSGNNQTYMIAHVSPAVINREESKNTLLYAERAKTISNKVEKNILDISYHVSQYRTIISELRDEIARLKSKIPEGEKPSRKAKKREITKQAISDDQADEKAESHVSELKREIMESFREQVKLRKRLLNIEGYVVELDMEADRQQSVVYECEGRGCSVYRGDNYSGKMPEQPDLGSLDIDYQEMEKESQKSFEKALIELALIEKEQEKYSELKAITEVELDKCMEKTLMLQKELPLEIDSEEERELLSLLIRIHELEVEKITLQTERLSREHTLRQRDMAIKRYGRQREICQEIITRQREIMKEEKILLPPDLLKLYQIYQQELHLYSFPDHNFKVLETGKLPPIKNRRVNYFRRAQNSENGLEDSDNSTRTASSSAGSDWATSPLPPISQRRLGSFTSGTHFPPTNVLFPPISKLCNEFR